MKKVNYELVMTNDWCPRIKHYAVIFYGDNLMSTEPEKQEQSGSYLVIPKEKGMLDIFSSDGASITTIHYKKLKGFLLSLQQWQVVLCLAHPIKEV